MAEKKRKNVHKFRVEGYIEVDGTNPDSVAGSSTAIATGIASLQEQGAVILKKETQFTTIAVEGVPETQE